MSRKPKKPGERVEWVDPPGTPERNRLPPGWKINTGIHLMDGDDPASQDERKQKARLNTVRQVVALQAAVLDVLTDHPAIRTGTALRRQLESDPDRSGTLRFGDPASVDRLLSGFLKLYKLGRSG